MSTPHVLECPACQMVDRADGVEDGNLYPVMAQRVKNERRIIRAVRKAQDQVADRVTGFAGSMAFVYIHALWFGAWVLINLGLHVAGLPKFDPYPFGLLTMIVSLEAIFLATLVMISQNRQAHRSDIRSEIDFREQPARRVVVGPCRPRTGHRRRACRGNGAQDDGRLHARSRHRADSEAGRHESWSRPSGLLRPFSRDARDLGGALWCG